MSPKNSERDGRRKSSDLPADIYQRLVESTRDYAMFILDTTGHSPEDNARRVIEFLIEQGFIRALSGY